MLTMLVQFTCCRVTAYSCLLCCSSLLAAESVLTHAYCAALVYLLQSQCLLMLTVLLQFTCCRVSVYSCLLCCSSLLAAESVLTHAYCAAPVYLLQSQC